VLPEYQGRRIGTRLIEAGLDNLRQRGCPFVVVLGQPEYYARFGFVPASRHGIGCPWEGVPDSAFMVLILDTATMAGVSGLARYRAEFDAAV
jgi:putative acetyltransferase